MNALRMSNDPVMHPRRVPLSWRIVVALTFSVTKPCSSSPHVSAVVPSSASGMTRLATMRANEIEPIR